MLLSIQSYRCGDAVVVVVAGEIDMLTAARMQETLVAQLWPRPETVVVDLEGVCFLSSMGLTALALTERVAREQGVQLRMVATSRATLRPLEITGMASDLAVYPSRAKALAGGSGIGPDSVPAPRTS
jgi:anti-anti-sigma factor